MAGELEPEAVVVTMHIGELAELSRMSLRTIRHYDEVGLLKPSGRSEGGFRLYTQRDVARLLLIRRMKPLGFTLEEMAGLLRVIDTLETPPSGGGEVDGRAELDEVIADAERRRATLTEQVAMADEFLDRLRAVASAGSVLAADRDGGTGAPRVR